MRKIFIPLLAALALPTAVNANIDPKVAEMCMKAVDFQGCVKAMTGQGDVIEKQNELLNEIRKLPSRISNTSLRDLSGETRSFRDALALSSPEKVGNELYQNAKKIDAAINILYKTWERKVDIDSSEYSSWSESKNLNTGIVLNKIFGGLTIDIRCDRPGFFLVGQDITSSIVLLINEIATEIGSTGSSYSISQEEYKIPSTSGQFCPGDPRRPKKVRKDNSSTKEKKPVKINCDSAVWKDKPRCN
tara:strand:- start:39 stop:776 length:738 start_codon:yes stop_codon:yes gene_type:complete